MKHLTLRQKEVLNLLIAYQKEHGFPPTTSELAVLLGCRWANAAAAHLKALHKKGVITLIPGTARGIRFNDPASEDEAIRLLRSMVLGEENAREQAKQYLDRHGVPL
ncbi:LexA family transcriptional regulator [Escherichia coli]|uniref:LexA family protein n=1 Tax=Escherichia coli TaxID=562 RepID=UPI001AB05728|nr:LexA family transcriptional regulator [Escherichia coli]MBO3239438.1 LexA family transcriptional regulator [Escherichia coli]